MRIQSFIKLNRELLSQPEVDDLLAEEGAAGLGIYVAVNLYLAHCEGGCGVYSSRQLSSLAVQLKKHRSDVDRIITKYGLFVIDGSRFTSLWMQQLYSKDAAKLLHSRAYLLMRAEDIDIDIEKEKKKKCVSLGDTHSQFETLRAGRRYASHGQPLPGEAPPQRRRNDMYSYIRHDCLPAEEFDKDAEMIVYRQLFGKEDA